MTRLLVAAWLVAAGALGPAVIQTTAAQTGVSSGGIGLSRDQWEAEHGTGQATQDYVAYEDGTVFVQFRDDLISYLEFGWSESGVDFGTAEPAVLSLLPSDAGLAESFAAPPTASGPTGLFIQRYESRVLAELFADVGTAASGSILVVYFESTATDRFEPNVSQVSIAVGFAS